ncbi:N-acetylmuramoyl-L-alanine amidase family protein, partial [Bacillus toyonensis]|uniref:N-acetylmuramoyl-L-alanine amidase family protein n=1 Tax=Bacillus toyonensis TaxID=155322 RepID=UPI003F68D000
MFKLYLDPGHGGTDSGAIGNELLEKELTLDIALRIRAILLNNYENVAVNMSRETDVFVSLNERTNAANDWQADYFLSIHINSADSSSANGYEDYIYIGLSDSSQTATIQSILHEEVIKTNELFDRGKKKDDFHVLRESNMEALLTENGFITNVTNATKLKDANWRQKVAEGHVNGLARAFNLTKKSNVFRVIVDGVQVGAYAKKENIVAAVQNHVDQSNEILIQKVPSQLTVAPPAPPSSLSRFMSTVNTGTLYAEGEQLGTMASSTTRDDIVVLDFGWPKYNKSTKTYGTLLFTGFGAGNTFVSTTDIASAVQAFAQGYHDQIVLNNNANSSKVIIAIGTNNKKGASSNHAQAWASMVDQVNSWIQSQNYTEITIAAASDMEMGWNSAGNTRKWVNGYKSYYLNNN